MFVGACTRVHRSLHTQWLRVSREWTVSTHTAKMLCEGGTAGTRSRVLTSSEL